MEKEIIKIKNVKGYLGEDGLVYLNLKDVARGLGFVDVKNEVEYIRWNRVKKYLKDFDFATSGENDFIPENIFYLLAMKGKNEIAKQFQLKVANEILPQIRKTGTYGVTEKDKYLLKIMKSSTEVERATAVSDYELNYVKPLELENKKQQETITVQTQTIKEYEPKVSYYDIILSSNELLTITLIAKDYGMSGKEMIKKLNEMKIQYKLGNNWLLYQDYSSYGYTKTKTTTLDNGKTVTNMRWTQKGRLFLYEKLKSVGILPLIEQE